MSETIEAWTNHEREFRVSGNRFYKRNLRPSEYKLDQWNKPYVPPLGFERMANEAACLRFIREKTTIPVPDVLEAYKDNGAFILVTRRLHGIEMNDLSPEHQAIVIKEVEEHVQALQTLRSNHIGGPTRIICPPQRLTQYFPKDKERLIRLPTKEDLVFCHCDLSQSDITVNLES